MALFVFVFIFLVLLYLLKVNVVLLDGGKRVAIYFWWRGRRIEIII